MIPIEFEWNEEKALANLKNHNISFEEAKTVFYDPNALVIFDPDHSDLEDRFIIMGMSQSLKLLVVCHCYRSNDEIIRIISARKAESNEKSMYGGRQHERTV